MYPFERFSTDAKQVLALAQEEAERARHGHIGTEHLLVALLRHNTGVAGRVLHALGADAEGIRKKVIVAPSESGIRQIVPTPRVRKVIEISFEEARRMGSSSVSTEHVLLALLIEGKGIAAQALNAMGISLERVRAEIEAAATTTERRLPALAADAVRLVERARELAAADGTSETGVEHFRRALEES
jgi:ATP-dependent Clp protease ATP-binding subunit ClpC